MCAGGPFMRTDDPESYTTWSYQDVSKINDYGNQLWKFGKEIWCNLEGRYMHIIADLRHLEGATPTRVAVF